MQYSRQKRCRFTDTKVQKLTQETLAGAGASAAVQQAKKISLFEVQNQVLLSE
jgi:hypothetical protein